MASNRGMGREEAIFWVALTIFGTGLYLVSDAHLWGGALLVIGLIGLLYSLRHEMTPGGYRTWIVVVSVGVATIVSGYDLYQRNQEPPQPITMGGSADVSAYPPSWSLLPGSSDASFVDARGTNNLQVDRNYVVGTGTFAHLIGGSNISITGNYAELEKQTY